MRKVDKMKRICIFWDSPFAAHDLDRIVSRLAESGENTFQIIAPNHVRTYPNVCVPLAALMDWYKSRGYDFKCKFLGTNNYVGHTCLNNPLQVENMMGSADLLFPLDKVWKYNSAEGESALVTAIVNAVRENIEVEKGIISSIEWCLNEVMDNVLQHSVSGIGYVMGQVHKEKKRVSLCVFDMGIGIYGSLKQSKHCPRTPLDGLTMALQEKITRDENVGQGNGMWGLKRIIDENGGNLTIESNSAMFRCMGENVETKGVRRYKAGDFANATLVDFQLDISNSVDIAQALNGHEPLDFWLEGHEIEDSLYFSLQKDSVGTGTRIAAQKLKNQIFNSLKEGSRKVILDFEGVNVVSSSFADELIGKIIAERGFLYFMYNFELKNVSPFNMSVINRSVEQRMAQKYYDNTLPDVDDNK